MERAEGSAAWIGRAPHGMLAGAMTGPLPLDGLRVLELGHIIAGPSAGLLLADLGADVIKVERPGEGDQTRGMPAGNGANFHFLNRNKRSDHDRSQGLVRGPRALPAPGPRLRHRHRQLRLRRRRGPRARLRRAGAREPAHHLHGAQGLPARAGRGAAVPRRAGPDVGGAGLHDGAARPADARRRVDRGRGRRGLRRHRGARRAAAARAHGPRAEDHLGAVRDDGVLGGPVAGQLRRHRRAVGADAGDPPGHADGLGHLPALHRGRRRAGLHRHHVQRPLGAVLRGVRPRRPAGRRAARRQQQARGRARLAAGAHRRGDAEVPERGAGRAAGAREDPVRAAAPPRSARGRSAPERIGSVDRHAAARAAARPSCRRCRCAAARTSSACAARRRSWASTRAKCSRSSGSRRTTSTRWRHGGSSDERPAEVRQDQGSGPARGLPVREGRDQPGRQDLAGRRALRHRSADHRVHLVREPEVGAADGRRRPDGGRHQAGARRRLRGDLAQRGGAGARRQAARLAHAAPDVQRGRHRHVHAQEHQPLGRRAAGGAAGLGRALPEARHGLVRRRRDGRVRLQLRGRRRSQARRDGAPED